MQTIKLLAVALSSAFLLNCGVEPQAPSTGTVESDVLLSCENRDGQTCTVKGPAGTCDNGTEEGGRCFCAQHNGDFPYHLVCG
jgi:hypothetical protein